MNDYLDPCSKFGLKLITAASVEPIATDEAKAHLRIDINDDDTYIDTLVAAARAHVENYLGRRLITQTWDLARNDFPVGSVPIEFPYGPVQSITSVKYTDTGGTLQTWSAANYDLDTYSIMPKVYPVFGQIWPATRPVPNAVIIRHVCGYGDDETSVPPNVKHAIKEIVGLFYEKRLPVEDIQQYTVPMSIFALLDSERTNWL